MVTMIKHDKMHISYKLKYALLIQLLYAELIDQWSFVLVQSVKVNTLQQFIIDQRIDFYLWINCYERLAENDEPDKWNNTIHNDGLVLYTYYVYIEHMLSEFHYINGQMLFFYRYELSAIRKKNIFNWKKIPLKKDRTSLKVNNVVFFSIKRNLFSNQQWYKCVRNYDRSCNYSIIHR